MARITNPRQRWDGLLLHVLQFRSSEEQRSQIRASVGMDCYCTYCNSAPAGLLSSDFESKYINRKGHKEIAKNAK
jgi:hypothetical protein